MQVGGAEKVVRIVAEAFAAAGHKSVVAATVPGRGVSSRSLAKVRIHDIGLRNMYWSHDKDARKPKYLKPLWHALDSHRPMMEHDVAHLLDADRPDVVNSEASQASPERSDVPRRSDGPRSFTYCTIILYCAPRLRCSATSATAWNSAGCVRRARGRISSSLATSTRR